MEIPERYLSLRWSHVRVAPAVCAVALGPAISEYACSLRPQQRNLCTYDKLLVVEVVRGTCKLDMCLISLS